MIVWINGELLDDARARVSPSDQGLLTGDGVFETLRVTRAAPFAARRHLDRLDRSAAGLRLPCPPAGVLRAAMLAVIEANDLREGRLRITVTGGPAPLGTDRAARSPTVIVAGGSLPDWPPATDVATAPWRRNEHGALVGIKSISYAENVLALVHARERGAGEAILANLAGNLCEGTGSNLFLVLNGRLVTPPLSAGCLAGVTRELVLELVDGVETDLPLAALAEAEEAFLTSSTRDVQPIRAVDGQPLAHCPGPVTEATAAAFRALVADAIDP